MIVQLKKIPQPQSTIKSMVKIEINPILLVCIKKRAKSSLQAFFEIYTVISILERSNYNWPFFMCLRTCILLVYFNNDLIIMSELRENKKITAKTFE